MRCNFILNPKGGGKMLVKDFVIVNQTGLHARPASLFVKKANSYKCNIKIKKDNNEVDAKSMISVLTLGAGQGSTISITTDGEDENQAMKELIQLLEQTKE